MKKNTADFSYRNALLALNVYRYESIEVLKDKKKTKTKGILTFILVLYSI